MKLPKSKEAMTDTLIGCAFMFMGILLPESLLTSGFEAHVGGIALGIGIGWIVKSYINYAKPKTAATAIAVTD